MWCDSAVQVGWVAAGKVREGSGKQGPADVRPWRVRLFGTTHRKVRLTLPDVERRLRAELEEQARSRVSADGGRLAPGLRSTDHFVHRLHVGTWRSSAVEEREAQDSLQKEAEEKTRQRALAWLCLVRPAPVRRMLPEMEREARAKLAKQASLELTHRLTELSPLAAPLKAEEAAASALPELERQAREKLVVEAEDRTGVGAEKASLPIPSVEDKVRATAAASIEKEIRDRLRKEAEERIKAELPVPWMILDVLSCRAVIGVPESQGD